MRARRAGNPPRIARSSTDEGEPRARRGPGAVGNGGIVAYRARSPARSAAEGHARTPRFYCVCRTSFSVTLLKPEPTSGPLRVSRLACGVNCALYCRSAYPEAVSCMATLG
jgi:hypothetical protein